MASSHATSLSLGVALLAMTTATASRGSRWRAVL